MAGTATLPRACRLRTPRDFRVVYSRGRRLTGKQVVVVALARPAHSDRVCALRVGVSVSKDHGRAVRRNKLKRILREAFRLERATLPAGLDLILIPKVPGSKLDLAALCAELRALVARLAHGEGRTREPGRPRA
jgi:ribonuclease P protein component